MASFQDTGILKIMKVRKDWIGSKKSATKGDLADLQEDIHADLQQFATKQDVKDAVRGLATKEDLKGLMGKETGEAILGRLDSMDAVLKKLVDLPQRVTKLENDVFKLKLRQ